MKPRLSIPLLLTATLCAAAQDDTTPPVRGGADPSDDAMEMGSPPGLAEGTTEEEMWPAATAEGWKKPVLVRWQRTFEDALQVARAENRPIMVAVNMDGEIASEHFAGIRYRSVDTAEMLSRYACVIASVYRHTPRDYDEDGNRVPCPRFGTVTCSEHIECERQLYEKYFDGRRISPRHIVLDLEERETQDVYYSWDTQSVITSFVKGVEGWPEPDELLEPTLEELIASARVEHREEAEKMYAEGDAEVRRRLLKALLENRVVDQVEVLRQAIFGFDLESARLARRALAQCETDGALDLIADVLKMPLEANERQMLLNAVERLSKTLPRARTLAALHSGLSTRSTRIVLDTVDLTSAYDATTRRSVDVQIREQAALSRPADPGALQGFALALLEKACSTDDPRYTELLFADAAEAIREVEALSAEGPRLDAARALIASEEGSWREAGKYAVAAVEAGLLDLGEAAGEDDPLGPTSRLRLLRLFARTRGGDIRRAHRSGSKWPGEWLADVNAAYSGLASGPLEDPSILVEHHDFLRWIGASPRADEVLEEALGRFSSAPELHERLRARLLWVGGPQALEDGYERRLKAEPEAEDSPPSQLTWFAGYASLVAAEHHRRRSDLDAAMKSYLRAAALFEINIWLHPGGADNCNHFRALGLAGQARVALEQERLVDATEALLASLELRPESAGSADGLSFTPVMTAKMLHARLLDAGEAGRADQVQLAMDALDPALVDSPAPTPANQRRRGNRRGGR